MNIPSTLRAGDTISWAESLSDYPAMAWILAFTLQAQGKAPIVITASPSGSDHSISVLPSVSKTWIAGIYSYQAYVYKGTPPTFTDKMTLQSGRIEILPDLTQATSVTDLRSHVKKVLDAIESLLEGKASADILGYSIAGRSISKMNPTELIEWRDLYRVDYQREIDAEKLAKGLDS